MKAAILFIDIRGFSKLAETRTPEEVAKFLSVFRTTVCAIVFKHGGTIDKFIGDAVLVVFGAPIAHEDDARRALKVSLEIREKINDQQHDQNTPEIPRIKVGIGGHFGEVFSGVIEAGQILEHSVIGDTVNVAERLERMTRQYQSDFVFSDEFIKAAGLQLDLQFENSVEIRGHKHQFKVWYG